MRTILTRHRKSTWTKKQELASNLLLPSVGIQLTDSSQNNDKNLDTKRHQNQQEETGLPGFSSLNTAPITITGANQ